MTDLNPKGLEAAVAQFLTDGGYSFGEPDLSPLSYHSTRIGRAIQAYIAAAPTQPVEAEPDGWEGYWPGAGSIDSVTRLTRSRFVMERWIGEGAEITPLYEAPPTVSALQARVRELEDELARRDMQLEVSANLARAALSPVQQEGGKP